MRSLRKLTAATALLAACVAVYWRASRDRVLVIIVPGTHANGDFWPNVIEGKATFGSELHRALGRGSKVYPFLWASSIMHRRREEAATNLAAVIDCQASRFDRICLVGHSHGGNVALLAAGRCKSRIDTVVCLATPHPYLRTIDSRGDMRLMPIYCSPRTRDNTRRIVALCASTDATPAVWSNELLLGLSENEAVRLTEEWRKRHNYPRLPRDGFLSRLLESGNLVASDRLSGADANLQVPSQVDDLLGVAAHHAIHSRRMGFVIGDLLRRAAQDQTADLQGLVLPADADRGEPVPQATHQAWLQKNQPLFHYAGWLLEQAEVRLTAEAQLLANDVDKSLPDPTLFLLFPGQSRPSAHTESQRNTLRAAWRPRFFVPHGRTFTIALYDDDVFLYQSLGGRRLTAGAVPSAHLRSAPQHGVPWSATLRWRPAHY